jgi:hypothetical protein
MAFEHLPGEVAGGFTVLDHHPAIDDGGGNAFGFLHETPGASGEIFRVNACLSRTQ